MNKQKHEYMKEWMNQQANELTNKYFMYKVEKQ